MIEGFASYDALLPKIWLQKIPGFGELKIPEEYPESSSVFSLDFSPEDANVIQEMESNLGTEESIITEEMIPENTILGAYAGTFDVEGDPGVETLLSPVPVGPNDIGVIAMHYNETEGTWEQIEDAHIVDGYVYGTVEEFSPIAIFTIHRDTFFTTIDGYNVFVCNGIPTSFYVEDNKTYAKDANGKVTEITGTLNILGGTIDGTDLDNINITIREGVKTQWFKAGSFAPADTEHVPVVKKCLVNVKGAKLNGGITGGYCACDMMDLEINVEDSYVNFSGDGESIWQKAPSADKKEAGNSEITGKAKCRKSKMSFTNCTGWLIYVSGNCGLMYTEECEATVKNCKFDYVILGGSNGGTNKSSLTVEGGQYGIIQTNNRGYINDAVKLIVKDAVVNNLFVAGDSTDSTVTGVTGKVEKLEVNGKSDIKKLWAGTQGGESIASNEELKNLLHRIAFSRDVTYAFGEENGAELFGDMIKIK